MYYINIYMILSDNIMFILYLWYYYYKKYVFFIVWWKWSENVSEISCSDRKTLVEIGL